MKSYIIYNPTNGAVVGFRVCPESEIEANLLPGQSYIEGELPPGEWHVDPITDTLEPGAVETRSLDQIKIERWEAIKQARTNAINASMDTPFGRIQCRDEDRQNITDAVLLANTLKSMGQPVAIPWTMEDNTVVTLSYANVIQIGLMLGQKVQTAHATARVLRTQLANATMVGDVLAVQWPQ